MASGGRRPNGLEAEAQSAKNASSPPSPRIRLLVLALGQRAARLRTRVRWQGREVDAPEARDLAQFLREARAERLLVVGLGKRSLLHAVDGDVDARQCLQRDGVTWYAHDDVVSESRHELVAFNARRGLGM